MPKATFENLPPTKRQRLIDLAMQEFASNDYETASITRIVAQAGIAKGSVYQYFENKQDWFLFLLEQAQNTLLSSLGQMPAPASSDFFVVLRWQMGATIQAALKHPTEAKLIQRAFTSHLPFEATIQKNAKALRHTYLRHAIETAQESGVLTADINPSVCLFVIDTLLQNLGHYVQELFALDMEHPESLENKELEVVFDQILTILQSGMKGKI
jgi:AcrR family transcriptional regulator